jgi:hypothetical protein
VVEGGRNLPLVQACTVIALDEERHLVPLVDVTRPCQRGIERFEFLVSRRAFSSGDTVSDPRGPLYARKLMALAS